MGAATRSESGGLFSNIQEMLPANIDLSPAAEALIE